MISQVQFGAQAMTASKQAMPESSKFDGPGAGNISGADNRFSPHANMPLANSGSNA